MKQVLALVLITTLLGACHLNGSSSNDKNQNVYKIDTPYGVETLYDEKVMPDVFAIAATRSANKILDDTKSIYESKGSTFLFIMEPKKIDEDIPNGLYLAQRTTRDIIEGSRTYTVVNNINDADYYLETLISKIEIDGQQDSPIIQYKVIMFDKEENKINEWVETIRKVKNDDRSWW